MYGRIYKPLNDTEYIEVFARLWERVQGKETSGVSYIRQQYGSAVQGRNKNETRG